LEVNCHGHSKVWRPICGHRLAGIGFIFLAVIICYLPLLYQAFSRREIAIALRLNLCR
jgi:hypothetical protein